MTFSEFEILCSEQVRRVIDENIDRDPVQIALDRRIEHASLVATQVKRLQRAKSKLPSYYAVRAILPPRAYEQSSSEQCAAHKALSGTSALDLTCGLGVDSLALSRNFERVVACECDEVLAAVTRYNLKLLGVENVEIKNCTAEEFLSSTTEHFDWIFVDPDRRGERGEKLVLLEDCSPDMVALYPRAMEVADRLCIKSSPLFDVAEAERKFGDCSVEVLSLGGECKQVNIYVDGRAPKLMATAVDGSHFEIDRCDVARFGFSLPATDFSHYRYLILPDVSLLHARLVAAAFAQVGDVWSHSGVVLCGRAPEGVLGRVFEIERVVDFGSKELKRELKGRRVEIYRRDFPLSNGDIAKKLSIKEGGAERWCFTSICGRLLAIKINPLNPSLH